MAHNTKSFSKKFQTFPTTEGYVPDSRSLRLTYFQHKKHVLVSGKNVLKVPIDIIWSRVLAGGLSLTYCIIYDKQRKAYQFSRGGVLEEVLGLESLASKIKSLALASKSQVLENCPVLGSRIALFWNR